MSPEQEAVERVLDDLPRAGGARAIEVGGLVVFVREGGGWPWYARPRPGGGPITVADVRAARLVLREHGAPEQLEWTHARAPELAGVAATAGLTVAAHPLLLLDDDVDPPALPLPDGARFADDAPLEEVLIAQAEGFGGGAELSHLPALRADLTTGRKLILAVVAPDGAVLCVGMTQHAPGGAELVGIATVETARRRGLAAALTAELARRARTAGARIVFLSAGDEATARTYERAGFRRMGTAGAAEPVG